MRGVKGSGKCAKISTQGEKMKKLSLDILQSFDKDIISILSSQRLESYKGNIEQYYANRILAFRAGHKIAELEIYLRNKMDFCLKKLVGEEWIKEEESLGLITQKGHTPLQSLSPLSDSLLSYAWRDCGTYQSL